MPTISSPTSPTRTGSPRTIALLLWDVVRERRAARRQRKRGEQHVERGGIYPLSRGAITVAMRDLNVAALLADIVEGVPVSYATFVGYDEVAHHSGIREPDAFAVLGRTTRQLARLERAIEQAPRPYHLVVLSDHGQTQGAPFRQRYGDTLEELVQQALARRLGARARGRGRGLGRPRRGARGRAPGPDRRRAACSTAPPAAARRRHGRPRARTARRSSRSASTGAADEAAKAIVLASGNLGLVYLPRSDERLTLEQIDAAHPGLWRRSPAIPASAS